MELITGKWSKRHRGTSLFEIPLSVWVPLCRTNRLIGLFENKYSQNYDGTGNYG